MAIHAKHLSAKERQAVIVEAVIDLAGKKNPDEITTTAFARHMGLTQRALFRHFPIIFRSGLRSRLRSGASIWQAAMTCVSNHLPNRLDKGATLFPGTIQGLVVQSLPSGNQRRMREDAPRVFAIYKRGIEVRP